LATKVIKKKQTHQKFIFIKGYFSEMKLAKVQLHFKALKSTYQLPSV